MQFLSTTEEKNLGEYGNAGLVPLCLRRAAIWAQQANLALLFGLGRTKHRAVALSSARSSTSGFLFTVQPKWRVNFLSEQSLGSAARLESVRGQSQQPQVPRRMRGIGFAQTRAQAAKSGLLPGKLPHEAVQGAVAQPRCFCSLGKTLPAGLGEVLVVLQDKVPRVCSVGLTLHTPREGLSSALTLDT